MFIKETSQLTLNLKENYTKFSLPPSLPILLCLPPPSCPPSLPQQIWPHFNQTSPVIPGIPSSFSHSPRDLDASQWLYSSLYSPTIRPAAWIRDDSNVFGMPNLSTLKKIRIIIMASSFSHQRLYPVFPPMMWFLIVHYMGQPLYYRLKTNIQWEWKQMHLWN